MVPEAQTLQTSGEVEAQGLVEALPEAQAPQGARQGQAQQRLVEVLPALAVPMG